MAGKPRVFLLVLWGLLVAALIFLAAHLSGYKWNIILGLAILGLVLFFRVSKILYPVRMLEDEEES